MPLYNVRVGLSCNFAQDKAEKNEDPLSRLKNKIPEKYDPELSYYRYTFGIYKLKADSVPECKSVIEKAWSETYPDEPDVISVLAAESDDTDTSKLMYSIYTGYYGVQAYQEMITELTASIPLLKERGALKALRMQSYLFAIDSGCGFTTLLSSFGDYLHRMDIYDTGDNAKRTNYTEYIVYKENDGERIGMDDLVSALMCDDDEITNNIIGIDISYFLEGEKFDELRRFIRRIYFLQNKYVFVFKIPFLEKKALDRVASAMSDLMLLRVIQIPPLHDYVLMECMWDTFRRLGFRPDKAVRELFFKKIQQEKKDGRFYGFKTAEKVVHEMIMKKVLHDADTEAKGEKADRENVTTDDLPGFSAEAKKEKNGYDELAELIGMETISQRVREIAAQVKLSMTNEKLDRPCIHMRFTGSPGTGKTTVARIVGQIFREEGILRKGAFLEYSARSLCAEYVGQTAVRTASICRDAYGSVLFIDEAYALYENQSPNSNDYGKEALTTLISEMENHRDDMLVIMAGYTDDMETLMKGNAGLRSRMPYMLNFPNYTRQQLFEIFMLMVRKHFSYTPELEAEAKKFFEELPEEYLQSREFANARFVRNLYERTWSKGSLRASLAGLNTIQLTQQDFLAASSEKEFSEQLEKKAARVGFN